MISRIWAILNRLLLPLSLLYVLLILASYFASHTFPQPFSIETFSTNRDTTCHWMNAMILFVECGDNVFAGDILEFFYNIWTFIGFIPALTIYAWTTLLFSPESIGELGKNPVTETLILTAQTSLIVAPLFYLSWKLVRTIGRSIPTRRHKK